MKATSHLFIWALAQRAPRRLPVKPVEQTEALYSIIWLQTVFIHLSNHARLVLKSFSVLVEMMKYLSSIKVNAFSQLVDSWRHIVRRHAFSVWIDMHGTGPYALHIPTNTVFSLTRTKIHCYALRASPTLVSFCGVLCLKSRAASPYFSWHSNACQVNKCEISLRNKAKSQRTMLCRCSKRTLCSHSTMRDITQLLVILIQNWSVEAQHVDPWWTVVPYWSETTCTRMQAQPFTCLAEKGASTNGLACT